MKNIITLILLALATFCAAQSNQVKTPGVSYSAGAPNWVPVVKTASELAIDTVAKRLYLWNRNTATWDLQGRGVDQTSGATPPAYTPGQTDSYLVINNATPPELYAWTGSAWAKVGGTIQTIDTFSVSGSVVSLSLSGDNQPAKTITLPASGITALTGDVTATGPGSAAATIANGVVTDAKIVSVDPNKLLQDGATTGQVLTWDGSMWNPATPSGGGWGFSGNSVGAGSYFGTTNNRPLPFRTNNIQRMLLDSLGNLGIGTSTPLAALDVNGQVKYSVGNWTRESRQLLFAASTPSYLLLLPAPLGGIGNPRIAIEGKIRGVRGSVAAAFRNFAIDFSIATAYGSTVQTRVNNEGATPTTDVATIVVVTYAGVRYYALKYNLTGASSPTTSWLDVTYNLEQTAPSNFLALVSTGVTNEVTVSDRRWNSTVNLSNGNRGIGSTNPLSKLTFGSTELFSIGMDRRVGSANGQALTIAAGGAQTGIISTFSISVAGTGYAVGDTIAVTETFGTYAILVVNSIGASGAATGFDVLSGGDLFDTGSSATSTLSGTGSGCIINILSTVRATNAAGGGLSLSGGISTGTGTSTISFLTATASASGATDNSPVERMRISTVGNLGVATTGPDRKVDVLDAAAPQMRLTHTDGSVFTDFQTTSSGHLNIVASGGFVGINTSTPTSRADITGVNGYTQLRLRTTYTPTSTADALGNVGDIAHDANYIYIKTASGWKRAALSTF